MPRPTLATRIRVQLTLAEVRLRRMEQQEKHDAAEQRKEVVKLLHTGDPDDIDAALVCTEDSIRHDIKKELCKILQVNCKMIITWHALLADATASKIKCDPSIEKAVKTLIMAAPKVGVDELLNVRALLVEKFGKEFVAQAMENKDGVVPDRVVQRLAPLPSPEVVQESLQLIGEAFDVPGYVKKVQQGDAGDSDGSPSGRLVQRSREPPLIAIPTGDEAAISDAEEAAARQSSSKPKLSAQDTGLQVAPDLMDLKTIQKEDAGQGIDLDELRKRFAALKR